MVAMKCVHVSKFINFIQITAYQNYVSFKFLMKVMIKNYF